MNRTPEQQWSALSALYEEADGLRADELKAWLGRLEQEGNPLLPQLKLMLEARSHLETDDFLGTLPKLSDDSANASDWHEGDRVGPYRLMRPLGEGGMAEVWLAERADGAFKRQVAIKLPYPRPGRETFAARFDRERDILATLRHPHIAGLFDAGVTKEGQAWLALEYVEGQPISTFCDERKLPVRERVQLFRQVLLAVQHAHANLVIHRDLKPGNILVTSQGEVRLLDFGIAKLLEAQGDAIEETELTRQAGRSLTPRYASPEQLMGLPLTTACDVYSLGVVFYELICGERPYELKVESPAQLEHAILEVEPRAPSRRTCGDTPAEVRGTNAKSLRKLLAPELDAIALRSLEKKPSARYSSVDAVLADVDRWLAGETVLARAPGAWYRFGKFAKRHWVAVGLSATAILMLIGVASVAIVLGIQAKQESARAIASRDFMLDLFRRADQEKSRGAEVTAREILETGRREVLSRLGHQPRLQAELLQGIATIQNRMGEYINADTTFADSSRLYLQVHMYREAAIAVAAHADNALRMGNPSLATQLIGEAGQVKAMHAIMDDELEARLKEVEGWIANIQVDSVRARDLFLQSRAIATRAFGPAHARAIGALRGLVFAERQLGHYERALSLQMELEDAVLHSSESDPKELAAVYVGRTELLYSAGLYADGLEHLRTALPRCTEVLGPNDERCKRLKLNQVQMLLRLGLIPQAVLQRSTVDDLAIDGLSPPLRADALFVALRLETARKDPVSRHKVFSQLVELGLSDTSNSLNPALKARALLALSESALMVHEPMEARHWLDKLEDLQRVGSLPRAKLLSAIAKSLRGVTYLQNHEPDSALSYLRPATKELEGVLGAGHPLAELFLLNEALALEMRGRNTEAHMLVQSAAPILKRALGQSAPTYIRLLELERRIKGKLDTEQPSSGAKSRESAEESADSISFFS